MELSRYLDAWLDGLSLVAAVDAARTLTDEDRERLRRGARQNRAVARRGIELLPGLLAGLDPSTRLGREVCAGVFARMRGEACPVTTLAGSGNKGITVSVPLTRLGRERGLPAERVDEALALACLVTSGTTRRIGALSSACGSAHAAGIGLAAGLVHLEGGGARELSLAVSNMVGSVAGVICDGAKVGCGLKATTAVDAAFRAASLAQAGLGVPGTDGIVGADGARSLENLGRIARRGLAAVEGEVLEILRAKPG